MKRNSDFYFKREKQIIKKLGLIPTKGSGSGWIEKEDGYNDNILTQLKSTEKESYRFKFADMDVLEYHAAVEGKLPLFLIDNINSDKLYAVVSVENLVQVAKYLFDKNSDSKETENVLNGDMGLIREMMKENFNDDIPPIIPRPVIRSGNKEGYWKDQEEERERKNKIYQQRGKIKK